MSRDKEIKTAFCPACGHKKVSAVKSKDGLCDDCGGRITIEKQAQLFGVKMSDAFAQRLKGGFVF